jgi:hypothetical protein
MKSWVITLLGLGVSWHYTDLNSESSLYSTFCPIMVAVFLIATVIKLATLSSGSKGGGFGGGSGGGFWGDGGSGDGGCGGGGGDC